MAIMRQSKLYLVFLTIAVLALPAAAAPLPCRPCAGVRLEASASPADLANVLRQNTRLEPGSPLYVAWDIPLTSEAEARAAAEPAAALVQAGATPWLSLVFTTPSPLPQAAERLQAELRTAVAVAAAAPAGTWFQVVWRPEGGGDNSDPKEYSFLLKRAAVALTGAQADARVATQPLVPDPKALETLYDEEVAAYLEGVALQPAPAQVLTAALETLQRLDAGRPVILDGPESPAESAEFLSEAARASAQGLDLALFRSAGLDAYSVQPLALLAREFKGDLSYDPSSAPRGAEGWVFVRGEDLGLRVIARTPPGQDAGALSLVFPDPQLRRPTRFPYTPGNVPAPGGRVAGNTLELTVEQPGRVAVLGLERPTAAELQGVEEKVTVSSEREIPVEEILRRLQAFEDAQDRRLDHYSAVNTTALRFQPAAGTQSVEATLQGPFFFRRGGGSDWAWESLFVNGVRWRNKTIPEIPLVQPEKAAALPLEIHFNRQYRYRLRGTGRVGDRDAWVIDFSPAGPGEPGKLYQGTVWVDRQTSARLKTRAVQIGLDGEVLSNEETLYYSPIDAQGQPAPWGPGSFVLPLRLVAQQILSVVNATTVVERETLLSQVRINGADFEESRKKIEQTDVTMVRDTQQGLRYLVKDESGGDRVVKEGYDTNKLFAVGGVFYDDALDYPLPLAGINYLSLDFRGSGNQLNAFFAGALLTVDFADPRFLGSKFDIGADAFALAIPITDNLYRDGEKSEREDVELRTGNFGLKLGRPLGNFVKLRFEYSALVFNYGEADDTAADFVVPADNVTHSFELGASFSRFGYGLALSGSYNQRSKWDFWGRPGNAEFDPDQKDFLRWEARASKNWYLPKFQKVGFEVDYASGADLDRFSKYQFGFFGGTRVHGYQSNKVRAEEVIAAHGSYGFEIGQAFRLEGVGDVAWATDELGGLKNELLGGVGVVGSLIGPWQTLINMDIGVPVAGPDDGFVAYLVFLKLFK
ncbi:MAG TPA: hypothetical protein VHU81_17365 [Thermoanaerobaculia bacterium]|nr:hypothetical protein [Thermoanaerobaculia bacterium]